MSVSKPFMYKCYLCGKEFQFSNHIYDGKFLAHYKMALCNSCYQGNWDGFTLHYEAQITMHLEENNIPIPPRNEDGLLPRDI